jgi:hypothetical protein
MREVKVRGGTFWICLWLFSIWMTLDWYFLRILQVLQEIASKL